MFRLVNQQDGNVDCDINRDNELHSALEALDYLGYSLVYVRDPHPRHKVIIEVLGGVAEVTSCPENVEVEIIDHDNKGR